LAVTASADPKGETILREAYRTLHAAKSFSATITATRTGEDDAIAGSVSAMKPNFLRVEMKAPADTSFIADGKSYFIYAGRNKQYLKSPLAAAPAEMQGMWEGEIDSFFGGEKCFPKGEVTYAGSVKVGDVDCEGVKVAAPENGTIVYAVGKTDHLIHRTEISHSLDSKALTQTNTLTNIQLKVPVKAADFAFNPPAGVRLFEPPNFEGKLIPVGQLAPRFLAPSPRGGDVSLSDALKGKKAVLVNFWFYG